MRSTRNFLTHATQYVPARGDNVIGTVVNKLGDSYKLQIGSHEEASLSSLAFAGATKKNRPQVAIGDLVFAKLLNASVDMEPELVCVDSLGQSAGLGPLSNEGFLFSVPLHHVRRYRPPSRRGGGGRRKELTTAVPAGC